MQREEADENFSPDDPENVVIPESLGPIAWEFFGTIAYRLKKKDHPAVLYECLQCLRAIQQYNKSFLINERRFEKEVFPYVRNYFLIFDKEHLNNLHLKILDAFCLLIIHLGIENTETNKEFINEIKSFNSEVSKPLEKNENKSMVDNLKASLKEIEKIYFGNGSSSS